MKSEALFVRMAALASGRNDDSVTGCDDKVAPKADPRGAGKSLILA